MASSQLSSTKMIFDATSLKDLLGSSKDVKKGKSTVLSSTSRPSKQSLEMIQSILKEETSRGGGIVTIKSTKVKTKKKKQSKKTRKSSVELGPGGLLEQVRLYRLSYNNVYEYASLMDVNRTSVDYIERQYRRIKSAVNSTINKVIAGHEQLSGPEAEYITPDDMSILLSFAGSSVDESTIYQLINSQHQKEATEVQPEDERIPLDSFLAALRTYLTLHAMTFCLGEMKGLIAKQKELLNQSSTREMLAAATSAAPSDSLPLELSLFTEFSSTGNPYMNKFDQPSTNSVFVSSAYVRPSSDPQTSVQLKAGATRGHLHSSTSVAALNAEESVTMQPSQSQGALGGGGGAGGADTFNSSFLPPLRINKQSLGANPAMKRKAMTKAGFDDSFTRPTPRVLHKNTGMADIDALRWELQATQEGMKQLDKLVDNNIAWVQSHCDMSSMQSNFSSRTKQKCKTMATDRIFKVYWRFSQLTTMWALQRWKIAVKYLELKTVSAKYAKIKSIDILTNTMYEVLTRQWARGFTPWFALYKEQKTMEQIAACVQIQRVVRGYVGRVRAQYAKIHRGSTVIQQMFRKRKAKRRVAAKRAEELFRRRDKASRRIQKFMVDYTKIRRAKVEVERRRKAKAVLKIQKIQRGKSTRMSVSRRMSISIAKATSGVIEKVSDVLKFSTRIKTPKSTSSRPSMDLDAVAQNVQQSLSKDEDGSIGFPSRPGTVPGEENEASAGSPKPKTPGSPPGGMSRGNSSRGGLGRQASGKIARGPSQHIQAAAAQHTASNSLSPVRNKKSSVSAARGKAAAGGGGAPAGNRRSSATAVASGNGKTHTAKAPVSKSFTVGHQKTPPTTAAAAASAAELAAAAAAATVTKDNKSRPSSTGIAIEIPPDSSNAGLGPLYPEMMDMAAVVVAAAATNPRSSAGKSRVTKGGVTKTVDGAERRSAGNSRTKSVAAAGEGTDGISVKALAEHNKLHSKPTKRDEDAASVASSTARSVKSSRSLQPGGTQRRSAGNVRSPPAPTKEETIEEKVPAPKSNSPSRTRQSRRSLTNDEIANAGQITSPSSSGNTLRTQRKSFDGEVSLRSVLSGDKDDPKPGTPHSTASRTTRASLDLSSRRVPMAGASPTNKSVHSVHSSTKSTSTYRSAASSKKNIPAKAAATNIQKMARGKIARAQSKKIIEAKMQSDRALDTTTTPEPDAIEAPAPEAPADEPLVIDTTPPADDKLAPLNSRIKTPDQVARDSRPRTCSPSRIIGAMLSPVRPLTSSSFFKNAFGNPLGEWLTGDKRPRSGAVTPTASAAPAVVSPIVEEEHKPEVAPTTAAAHKPSSPLISSPTASSKVPPLQTQKSHLSDGAVPTLSHQQSHLSTQSNLEAMDTLMDLPQDVNPRIAMDYPSIAEETFEPGNASPAGSTGSRPESAKVSVSGSAKATPPTSARGTGGGGGGGSVKNTPPTSARTGSLKASSTSAKVTGQSPGKPTAVTTSAKGKSVKQPSSTSTKGSTGSAKGPAAPVSSKNATSKAAAVVVVEETPVVVETEESAPEADFQEVNAEAAVDVFDVPPSAEEEYEQQRPELHIDPETANEEAVAAEEKKTVAGPEKLRSRPSSEQNVHRPTPPHTPHGLHTPHHEGGVGHSAHAAHHHDSKPHTPKSAPHAHHAADSTTTAAAAHKTDPSARKSSTSSHHSAHSQHGDGHSKVTPSKSSDNVNHHPHGAATAAGDHKHDTPSTHHATAGKTDAKAKGGKKDTKTGKPAKPTTPSKSVKSARPAVDKDPVTLASERIQTIVRIKLARIRANKQRKVISKAEEDARNLILWSVVSIQRVARGKIGHNKFRKIYDQKKAQLAASQNDAAVLIQTRARGIRDRVRVKGLQQKMKDDREEMEWLKSYQNKTPNKFSKPAAGSEKVPMGEGKSGKGGSPSIKSSPGSGKSPSTKSAGRVSSASKKKKLQQATQEEEDPEDQSTVMDTSSTLPTIDQTTKESGSNATAAAANVGVPTAKELELDERLKKLERMEKEAEERVAAMKAQELKVQEQQKAIQDALDLMAKRAKEDEVERQQREMLLQLAQGAISHRSEFASTGPRSARAGQRSPGGEYLTSQALATLNKSARGSSKYSARSNPVSARNHEAPPTARSARGGAGIPPDARRMMHGGEEWVQLWDPEEAAYYWYCERTQLAQWETPGGDFDDQSRPDSGYESAGAMTDYSTDYNSEFGGEYTDSEYGDGAEWHEYWDEAAQAKYWYNNNTGEASWTKPPEATSRGHTAAIAETAYTASNQGSNASAAPFDNPNDWAEFIDEDTGQGYWYNSKTGQSSWV